MNTNKWLDQYVNWLRAQYKVSSLAEGDERSTPFTNSIGDNIKKTEEEKQNALREFEETVKPDLVKEVEGRYLDKLNLMREELAKKKDEYMKLDDLIKQQRIYISSNYEAYLGKEFINVQRLTELDNIISSGEAQTISQAMAVYKNRK